MKVCHWIPVCYIMLLFALCVIFLATVLRASSELQACRSELVDLRMTRVDKWVGILIYNL